MSRERHHDIEEELLEEWQEKATENVEEWGEQGMETLLLAMQEELGELTRAFLEYRAGAGYYAPIFEELNDLGPLLIQFFWAASNHTFNDLTDGDEVRAGEGEP